MYEFPFASKIPEEVTSFVTLIRPFDNYTWIMAIVSSIITYFMLVLMQKLWSYQSGEPFENDFLYQGISSETVVLYFLGNDLVQENNLISLLLADLCITIFLIDEGIPDGWINRRGFFWPRKFIMLTWLMFAGSILLCGYKSTLLSTLIPIYYESTIETLIDVSNSDLPLTVPKNTAVHWLIGTDPRSAAKNIRGKLVLFPFNGLPPPWVNERYLK